MPERKEHSFIKLAQWKVDGREITGEMAGCTVCGLVLVNDRRGILLIHGGLGSFHKHLSPTQRVPQCAGRSSSASATIKNAVRELALKRDPRFQLAYRATIKKKAPSAPRPAIKHRSEMGAYSEPTGLPALVGSLLAWDERRLEIQALLRWADDGGQWVKESEAAV